MLKEMQPGILQSDLFINIPGVTHGFSTRVLGDMRDASPRQILKKRLGITKCWLIGAEQKHGSLVHTVIPADYGKTVSVVDGLVFHQGVDSPRVALGIITADCIPLLFVDPEARVIGAAHAGWKGTRDRIASNTIQSMVEHGAKRENIFVTFGPYIGSCCYSVEEDRAAVFKERFRSDVVMRRGGRSFLDLGKANEETLLEEGIQSSHIGHQLLCTFDHADTFYSNRKERLEGEQMGLIALSP